MIEDDDETEDLDDSALPDDDEIISKNNPIFAHDFVSSKMSQVILILI